MGMWAQKQDVVVVGLRGAPELNGKSGVIKGLGEAGRLAVEVEDAGRKSVRPSNLAALTAAPLVGDRVFLRSFVSSDLAGKIGVVVEKRNGEQHYTIDVEGVGQKLLLPSQFAVILGP